MKYPEYAKMQRHTHHRGYTSVGLAGTTRVGKNNQEALVLTKSRLI